MLFVTGYVIVLEIKRKIKGEPQKVNRESDKYQSDKQKQNFNKTFSIDDDSDPEARTLNLSVDIESFYKSRIIPESLGEFKSAVIPFSQKDQEVFKDIQAQIKNRNANIFMKVRLLDLVKPLGKRSQISSIKSSLEGILVDFVVCDRSSGKVLFTVQNIVNDLTQEEMRIQQMISKVLDNAGITNIMLDDASRENEYFLEKEISKLEFN